jgi:hypothetical protein
LSVAGERERGGWERVAGGINRGDAEGARRKTRRKRLEIWEAGGFGFGGGAFNAESYRRTLRRTKGRAGAWPERGRGFRTWG